MRSLFLSLCGLLLCAAALAQAPASNSPLIPSPADSTEQILFGPITPADLHRPEACPGWMDERPGEVLADRKTLRKLRRSLKGKRIHIIMGSWCGDSRDNVPPFLRLLNAAGFPDEQLSMEAMLPRTKAGAADSHKGQGLHRVPLFLVYDEAGQEIGRLVEDPQESLAADLLAISSLKAYQPRYPIANRFLQVYEADGLTAVKAIRSELLSLAPQAESYREFSTLTNVLLGRGEMDAGIYACGLGLAIYPQAGYLHMLQGQIEEYQERPRFALAAYRKALGLFTEQQNQYYAASVQEWVARLEAELAPERPTGK